MYYLVRKPKKNRVFQRKERIAGALKFDCHSALVQERRRAHDDHWHCLLLPKKRTVLQTLLKKGENEKLSKTSYHVDSRVLDVVQKRG